MQGRSQYAGEAMELNMKMRATHTKDDEDMNRVLTEKDLSTPSPTFSPVPPTSSPLDDLRGYVLTRGVSSKCGTSGYMYSTDTSATSLELSTGSWIYWGGSSWDTDETYTVTCIADPTTSPTIAPTAVDDTW
jgi:hypothetical protein